MALIETLIAASITIPRGVGTIGVPSFCRTGVSLQVAIMTTPVAQEQTRLFIITPVLGIFPVRLAQVTLLGPVAQMRTTTTILIPEVLLTMTLRLLTIGATQIEMNMAPLRTLREPFRTLEDTELPKMIAPRFTGMELSLEGAAAVVTREVPRGTPVGGAGVALMIFGGTTERNETALPRVALKLLDMTFTNVGRVSTMFGTILVAAALQMRDGLLLPQTGDLAFQERTEGEPEIESTGITHQAMIRTEAVSLTLEMVSSETIN